MKVKRFMTLLFLMLASMLLLLHAVLPHFHHDSVVCFTSEKTPNYNNSSSDSEGYNLAFCCNGTHKATHHHHEQSNLEDCDLKDVVIRQDNSQESDIIQSVNFLSTVYIIYALNTFYLEASDFEHQFQEKPYLNNYCSLLLNLTSKLRGPPAFSYLG